jgi:iron complex transport system substrate-binding protein
MLRNPILMGALLLVPAPLLHAQSASPAAAVAHPATRTVVDATGQPIEIPYIVNRVADAWHANNGIVVLLGGGKKLVATTTVVQGIPWFQKLVPQVGSLPAPFTATAGAVNLETLIAARPDVLLCSAGSFPADTLAKLKEAKVPVVQMPAATFDDLKATVRITGEVLGPQETAVAAEYVSYLEANIKRVAAVTAAIPAAERPGVLHTSQYAVMSTDGAKTLIDAWIGYAGGVNVAAKEITGNQKPITAEQIAVWDPEVVIVGTAPNGDNAKAILADPKWSSTKAVKNNKVVPNPTGVYLWDRYSAEEALQILWAAKLLYPDKFKDLDVAKETKAFYAKFFHYSLTDRDVASILNAMAP